MRAGNSGDGVLNTPNFGVATTNFAESFNGQATTQDGMRMVPIAAAVVAAFDVASRVLAAARERVLRLVFCGITATVVDGPFMQRLQRTIDKVKSLEATLDVRSTPAFDKWRVPSESGVVVN
jgi:hypothetical protein